MSNVKITICPVCNNKETESIFISDPVGYFYTCPVCGRYEITEYTRMNQSIDINKMRSYLFYKGFKNKYDHRYHTTLSKEICDQYNEKFKNGDYSKGQPVHMDNETINSWYPRSFAEKIDAILIRIHESTNYYGQEMLFSKEELNGLLFLERFKKNSNEELDINDVNRQIEFFIDYMEKSGYVDYGEFNKQNIVIRITPTGYQRIEHLQRITGEGRNVLVAMKFGQDTKDLREAIRQGISAAGYNPILIDEVEHNELITPELLSHIKKSRFVVVDLTHQNNGAYFEEGYAMGLGKPVIQLCKAGTKLHFDIAQKNTIIWNSEKDIPLRLKNRILATID